MLCYVAALELAGANNAIEAVPLPSYYVPPWAFRLADVCTSILTILTCSRNNAPFCESWKRSNQRRSKDVIQLEGRRNMIHNT